MTIRPTFRPDDLYIGAQWSNEGRTVCLMFMGWGLSIDFRRPRRMSEKVELRQAWVWTCPECGTDQHAPCVVMECTPEENRAKCEEMGLDEGWFAQPFAHRSHETCERCLRTYPVVQLRPDGTEYEDDDGDDDDVAGETA